MRVQLQLSGLHVTVLAMMYDKGQVITTGVQHYQNQRRCTLTHVQSCF